MKKILLALICGLFLHPQPANADTASKEYLVKAAFLYNFVKFIEWPGALAVSQHNKLDICVMGSNPFASATAIFKEASTPSLALNLVQEGSAEAAIKHCHILFISNSEHEHVSEVLQVLKGKPVLTVSDIDGFAKMGGKIGFVLVENKVKLVVNRGVAEAAGLHVDAQLLEIAVDVIR